MTQNFARCAALLASLSLSASALAAPVQIPVPPGYTNPGTFNPDYELDKLIDVRNVVNHPVYDAVQSINAKIAAGTIVAGDHVGVIMSPNTYESFGFGPGSLVNGGTTSSLWRNMSIDEDVHVHLMAPKTSPLSQSARDVTFAPSTYTSGSGANVELGLDYSKDWEGHLYFWYCDFKSQGQYNFFVGTIPRDNISSIPGPLLVPPSTSPKLTRPFQKSFWYGCRFLDNDAATEGATSFWTIQAYRTSLELHKCRVDQEWSQEHFVYLHGTYAGAENVMSDCRIDNCGGQVWQQTSRNSEHPSNLNFDGTYDGRSTTKILGTSGGGFGRNAGKGASVVTWYSTGADLVIRNCFFYKETGYQLAGDFLVDPENDPDDHSIKGPGFLTANAPCSFTAFYGAPVFDSAGVLFPTGLCAEKNNPAQCSGNTYVPDPLLYPNEFLTYPCGGWTYGAEGMRDEKKIGNYHCGSIEIDRTVFISLVTNKPVLAVADAESLTVKGSFLSGIDGSDGTARDMIVGYPLDEGAGIGLLDWKFNNQSFQEDYVRNKLAVDYAVTMLDGPNYIGGLKKPNQAFGASLLSSPECFTKPFASGSLCPTPTSEVPSDQKYMGAVNW